MSLAVVLLAPLVALADFPYPKPPPGTDPSAFGRYAFLPQKEPPEVPNDFNDDWKLSSGKTGEAAIDSSPQELFGVRGASVDRAWQVTTGRPDVRISVLDSGIRWQDALPDLVNKFFINRGELPRPKGSWTYDKNRDGVFNVQDYAGDPRATDRNGNGLLDPQDLIKAFSDGRDDDHNGYVDDISGWDFAEDDNDPADLVRYGHGTGESEDSGAEANNGMGGVGSCPNCMLIEERVGDSFVADVNHFAPAVAYAVDNGASVVQEALGTVNNSSFAREAVQYAYRHNVAVIASAADEEAKHHNYPSNYPDTIVVNSVTKFDSGEAPHSYLFLNGCTNYGGHMAVAIPSSSCSSEATGKAAGMAGLLYSAARNAGRTLTANEVRQLFTMKADDIDFLTAKPPAPAANFATSQSVASRRFPSIPGYDEYFGYGRANADRMVRAVAGGNIPPEAEITDPDWYTIVSPADGRLVVRGRVDARRARSYGYEVSVGRGTIRDPGAPGFGAPNESPLESEMHPVCSSRGLHRARHGVLCSVSMARLRAALGNPPTSGPLDIPAGNGDPDRFSFVIRVRVRDDHNRIGEDRRSAFLHQDADALPGFPRRLPSDGETSPRLADLNGDGVDDVLLGTSDGIVHAYRGGARFGRSELPGWPVYTSLLPSHRGAPANRAGLLRGRHAALSRSVAAGDIDGDGRPEVVVSDASGYVFAFDRRGRVLPGFPVRTTASFSAPLSKTQDNRTDRGFLAGPTLANLDGRPGLEIVDGGMDRHLYAWTHDGRPLRGFPVQLVDPTKVQSIDPVTHAVTFKPDAAQLQGTKIIDTASIGDVDGDGRDDIVVGTNEEYREPLNATAGTFTVLGSIAGACNSRLYAVRSSGAAAPGSPFLPGFPAKIGQLGCEILPVVGDGVGGQPALADLDGDGRPEIGVLGTTGPGYLLRGDGSSFLGNGADGKPRVLDAGLGAGSDSRDQPSVLSLGGGAFGRLTGGKPNFIAAAGGIGRQLDIQLSEDQTVSDDQLSAFDSATGLQLPAFPRRMADLSFLNAPAVADVDGDGRQEALQGTAVYDLHAISATGAEAAGFPRMTGGWMVTTPAVGDVDGDGRLEVVAVTREGYLLAWNLSARASAARDWPEVGHDARNTANLTGRR